MNDENVITDPEHNLGKYVVVRTYSAGVHVGILTGHVGREVSLMSARRIWRWDGANTLNEVSLRGVGDQSRVSETVREIILLDAIEIIPCAKEGEENLRAAKWAK